MAINQAERLNYNDSALYCYGTAYIFEQRLLPLKRASKILAFSSLVGPLAIGALVIAVGTKGDLIVWAAVAASILSAVQIVISLWALIAQWQNKLLQYEESVINNYQLAAECKDLADNTSSSEQEWRMRAEVLDKRAEFRRSEDLKQSLTEEEKRMGLRYALRKYQRPCASCYVTPVAIEASTCPVCGQFKIRRLKWLT